MSLRRLFSPVSFAICCLAVCIGMTGTSPAFAQKGMGDVLFPLEGVPEILVNASGGLPGVNPGPAACPFTGDVKKFEKAAEAAIAAGDKDGCPFFKDGSGKRKYLEYCSGYYADVIANNTVNEDSPEPNPVIQCCHLSSEAPAQGVPSPRESCISDNKLQKQQVDSELGLNLMKVKIVPSVPGLWSRDTTSDVMEAKKEEAEARKQCLDVSLERIQEYWLNQMGKNCFKTMSSLVKTEVGNLIRDLRKSLQEKQSTAGSSTAAYGTSPGATFSLFSIPGAIQMGVAGASYAGEVIKVATKASEMIDTISKDCGNIVPQLKQFQEWRKNALGRACQAVSNMIERMATQCIRVNLSMSASLRLPQLNVLMQCPININIRGAAFAGAGASGFKCFDAGAGVQGGIDIGSSLVGKSLLSKNGGLEKLFNGKCFGQKTTSNPGIPSTGGRVPGVDCATLDPQLDAVPNIQGQKPLGAGRAVSSGWVVGGSETVDGITFTRCDYFSSGRKVKTTYVYGQGSSCNTSASGFTNGGYETNTTCYAGGYTPAASNMPDACLYDASCLNPDGTLDATKLGTSVCPTSTNPPRNPGLDPNRTYGRDGRSCADFAEPLEPVMCCDPQKQDCSMKDANTPICQCDEGDAENVVVNTQTGQCSAGGAKTCCSPRINGSEEYCETNPEIKAAGLEICEAERNLCVKPNDPRGSVYVGPDGSRQPWTIEDLSTSKPSPYIYLFVRPDAQMGGQQCCTTEWCNICPQHYANAYGLTLKRDKSLLSPKMVGDLMDAGQFDSHNYRLIGQGWPFQDIDASDDEGREDNRYVFGREVMIEWKKNKFNPFLGMFTPKKYKMYGNNMDLYVSDFMKMPVNLDNCSRTTGLKAFKKGSMVISSGMGFVGGPIDVDDEKKQAKISEKNQEVGMVPELMEYPLDYMNRVRMSMTDSTGVSQPAIPLCSEVKICLPTNKNLVGKSGRFQSSVNMPAISGKMHGTGTGVVVTGTSTGTNTAPVITTPTTGTTTTGTTTAPAVRAPVTTAPTTTVPSSRSAGSATTSAPTTVPSASNSSGSGPTSVPSLGNSSSGSGTSRGGLF